ncbi:MAG: glycosyl hydrolase [Bacteroidota bacterium]
MTFFRSAAFVGYLLISTFSFGQKSKPVVSTDDKNDPFVSGTFAGLKFRSIGPAITSGRIVDLAVNPNNISEYYVASANGGVWKTTNAGVTYDPIFDGENSFSIGCVAIDPNNTNTIWVGSGENNNQRVVSYGDGIYKSEDGGKSWKNMGLTKSEHIGRIVVDPNNSDIVYVAAYGPLWNSGGERGIYKTTDGGKTWKSILSVSEHTGFNEIHIDPRHSNILYATAHQRQRKVFTYIGGGPESALYKSTDGGNTWNKVTNGLPSGVDLGRIGLAVSPVNPDYVYAIIEAADSKGGVFLSKDRGASWVKQSSTTTSGNYYQEIFCDPKNINRLYSVNVYFQVSDDGGKTFHELGERSKHVDNHVIWVNPANTDHMLVGCDGGLYESFDAGQFWNFKQNIPVTQFYKVSLDNSFPFYNVYGGTQDNFSLGGPARTKSGNGIVNSDWFITNGGDGFESQADYKDSNIVYAQSQYGGLVRFDRKSGEALEIKPVEADAEAPYRWNWDAPLLISRHDHKRLYFGSNKLFRTDDQGNTWQTISGDLSRGVDRNKFPVMGKIWSVDAVAKNGSTDIYGQLTTIAESPIDEKLLYAGTDDGLVYVTTNSGKDWTKIDNISGVPGQTYVNQIIASPHDKNTAFVAFNHHRYGDFKPYLFKTTDAGKTWVAIQNNLPERGTVYCVAQDHVNANLLFAGTEFGLFFSINGGAKWTQLKGGLPTISVKDMEIQARDNDLVIATFGRGFYVLDDYTPLRNLAKEDLNKTAFISPVKDAWMFLEYLPLGIRGKGFMGESYWSVPNPAVGTTFTYYLKENIKTLREKRQATEAEKTKKGEAFYYPSLDSLRMEDAQPAPHLLFTITDELGNVVRQLKTTPKKGINRITWDFRTAAKSPIDFTVFDESKVFSAPDQGILVLPGAYKVALSKYEDGKYTELADPQTFNIAALNMASMAATDKKALNAFGKKVEELHRVVDGTEAFRNELLNKIKYMKQAALETAGAKQSLHTEILALEKRLKDAGTKLNGDASLARREFEAPTSINARIGSMMGAMISSTAAPTKTFVDSYEAAVRQFTPVHKEVKAIDEDVKKLEQKLEQNGAPYTPGRLPDWKG